MTNHRYVPDSPDWGFGNFYELRRLFTTQENFDNPLISNNKVNISAYIRILNDPTGVLWREMSSYNSKSATGFTGLKNQGATCYLNSLLQSLYFTTAFRHLVLQIPAENEPTGIPYALQRLFTQLNDSEQPVDTLQLTKSFGWDTADAFTQHDVQELNRVLMDNLEGKMKGTKVEGYLNNIFVGQFKSYIKCVNVDFESSRIEDYWDIQLNVKGLKNVEESFRDYIQVEMLDGENQYMATDYGLQDAKKGVVFKSFPPVLNLQLKRYDFDPILGDTVKINDRYEFPLEIDLSPFLDEDSRDPKQSYEYELHGVLVHCGDLNLGHYYALLKPTKNGPWYKFDDDKVTRATMKEVMEDNFGGDQNLDPRFRTRQASIWRHTSAYMLVYIRKSKINEILFEDKIPDHILERVQQERVEEENRRREREEQHLYMNVRLVTAEKQFKNYHAFDIAVFPNRTQSGQEDQPADSAADSHRVKKSTTVSAFLDYLASDVYPSLDRQIIRLWTMAARPNKTYRLSEPIPDSGEIPLEKFLDRRGKGPIGVDLFLEILSPEMIEATKGDSSPFFRETDKTLGDRILLFLKFFDPLTQSITGVKTHVVYSKEKTSVLVPVIREAMGWSSDTPVLLWEEIKPFMIDPVVFENTFFESELVNGDIITFEKEYSKEFLDSHVPADGFRQPAQYYDFLCNRVLLTFRHRSDPEAEKDGITQHAIEPIPDFNVWISKTSSYEQMANKLAEHIKVDALHLQFFTTLPSGKIYGPVERGGNTTVENILQHHHGRFSPLILYNVLRMSLSVFETKRLVKFVWIPKEGIMHGQRHESLVPREAVIEEILQQLPEKVGIKPEEVGRVKIWLVRDCLIYRLVNPGLAVESIQDSHLCMSLMSDEEYEYQQQKAPSQNGEEHGDKSNVNNYKLIEVFHFYRDLSETHGIPFTFVLKRGEKLKDTKARLQKMLGMYDKVFERIKFAVVRRPDANNHPSRGYGISNGNHEVGNGDGSYLYNNNRPKMRYIVDNEVNNEINNNVTITTTINDNNNNTNEELTDSISNKNNSNDDDDEDNNNTITNNDDNNNNNKNQDTSSGTSTNDEIELFKEIADYEMLGLDQIRRAPRNNHAGERAIFIKS